MEERIFTIIIQIVNECLIWPYSWAPLLKTADVKFPPVNKAGRQMLFIDEFCPSATGEQKASGAASF